MDANEKRIQLLGAIGHFFCHSYMLVFPAVLLLVAGEFSADLFRIGVLGNVAYLAFGIGAAPAGWLADRIGARPIVLLFLYGSSVTAILLSRVSSFAAIHVGFLFLGIFASLYHPAGLTLISTIRERGRALAVHGVFGTLSIAVAPFLFALIGSRWGWRGAYLAVGCAGLLFAVLASAIPVAPHLFAKEKSPSNRLAEEGKGGQLVLLYAIAALNGLVYRGVLTYLPTWLSQVNGEGFDLVKGGLVTSLALLLGVGGQIFGGAIYKSASREKLLLLLVAGAAPLLYLIGRTGYPLVAVVAALFLFLHFSTQPVVNGLVAQYTRSAKRSLGYGFSFFMGFGAGSFASSAAGFVADRSGMAQVFPFLALFSVMMVLLGLVLYRRHESGG